MKFLVPNYSCLQNSWLGDYRPQIPVLSVLCPQLNLLNPPEKNFWVRHWTVHITEHTENRKKLNAFARNYGFVTSLLVSTIRRSYTARPDFEPRARDFWLFSQVRCNYCCPVLIATSAVRTNRERCSRKPSWRAIRRPDVRSEGTMRVTQEVSLVSCAAVQTSALELCVHNDELQTDIRSAVFIGVSQHIQRIRTKT